LRKVTAIENSKLGVIVRFLSNKSYFRGFQ